MRERWLSTVLTSLLLLALLPAGAGAEESAEDQLDRVTDLMRDDRMDEALANLTALQDAQPGHLRAWMIRGLILAYDDQSDEARAEAEERLAADPRDGGGLALSIGVAVGGGDDGRADEASRLLVEVFPESADAWDIRGGVLSLGDGKDTEQEAPAALDRALAIDPRHVDALINRGELAGPTDPAAAEGYLRRAVEARPGSTDANEALTVFLVGQERTGDALEAYDAWLAVRPANPIALIGKATVLAEEGRYDEALWLVENVVRDDPDSLDGLYLKGQLLLALGRPSEAVDTMNDLLARYPGDQDAEALRSEAASQVQSAASGVNTTQIPPTPTARSPAPASAAAMALVLFALARRRR